MADATRERILEAAISLLQSSGIESLTMETTADIAGVSRKTIYNHFENKYKLVDGVANFWMQTILTKLQTTASDAQMGFVEKLNRITELGFAEMRRGGLMLKRRNSLHSDTRLPSLHHELRTTLRGFIEQMVSEAKETGIVRQDFETKRLTWVLINIVEGLLPLDELDDSPFSKADILRDSLRAVVGGILSEQGVAAMQSSLIFSEEKESEVL